MEQATIQMIAIIASISALLGWVVRRVLNHFIDRNIAKDDQIVKLVSQNQENVSAFRETINHNQERMNKSVDGLTRAIKKQTKVLNIIHEQKK